MCVFDWLESRYLNVPDQMAAIRFAKYVSYSSAGTLEFLYLPDTQEYFFLEFNPRLQVEHPCTEAVCDVNIPSIQLQVAIGLKLDDIPEVARYKERNPSPVISKTPPPSETEDEWNARFGNFFKKDDNINCTELILVDVNLCGTDVYRFYVNKQILSLYSPIFHALFFGDSKDINKQQFIIEDVDPCYFGCFLQVIYQIDKITKEDWDDSAVYWVLKMAEQLKCPIVKERIENWLLTFPYGDSHYESLLGTAEEFSLTKYLDAYIKQLEDWQLENVVDNDEYREDTRARAEKELTERG